jgi:hypothetical protein
MIAVLFRGKVPFVLRPMEQYYYLMGECFVNGVMDGEGIEGGGSGKETFEIHW